MVIIPNNSIRLRIIANSNSIDDQNNKMLIKKEMTKYLEEQLNKSKNINDVDKTIVEKLEDIDNKIDNI